MALSNIFFCVIVFCSLFKIFGVSAEILFFFSVSGGL